MFDQLFLQAPHYAKCYTPYLSYDFKSHHEILVGH